MQIDLQRGVVGRAGTHWGTDAKGDPVLLIESSGVNVRISMTPAEACEHGQQAIFVGFGAKLAAGTAPDVRPASALVRPSGEPL